MFSTQTGALVSYVADGQELLETPLEVSLYRPVTDNDNRDRNAARLWKKAGLDRLTQKLIDFKTAKKEVMVDFELVNPQQQKVAMARMSYTLATDGQLKVITVVKPDTAVVKSLARIGLVFEAPDELGQVGYLGRGDVETYADRMECGRIGIYHTSADRMFHYYVTPPVSYTHLTLPTN